MITIWGVFAETMGTVCTNFNAILAIGKKVGTGRKRKETVDVS